VVKIDHILLGARRSCGQLHGFCLVLLFDGSLSLVMLIEVGNIWCCLQISQIFGAANKLDCFSLVLPDK
jgi:hypothetical protein